WTVLPVARGHEEGSAHLGKLKDPITARRADLLPFLRVEVVREPDVRAADGIDDDDSDRDAARNDERRPRFLACADVDGSPIPVVLVDGDLARMHVLA